MSWTIRRDPRDADWRVEMTATNLARLRWVWWVGGALVLAFLAAVAIMPSLQHRGYERRSLLDLVVIAVFLAAGAWARRRPRASAWRWRYVGASVVVALVSWTTWHVEGLRSFGPNSDYVLGVVSVAAFIVTPPPASAAMLAINHVLLIILVFSTVDDPVTIAGLIDDTFAVVLAWFVGWFLYRAHQAEFFEARSLEAANAELREVMAIAAHDLRSPLLGMRDLLDLAGRDHPDGRAARALTLASDSCRSMVQLVTRMLDAHVAEESRGVLVLEPYDLRAACEEAQARIGVAAAAKRQHLHLAIPAARAIAHIDRAAFAQVIDNLLGNAVKFSPPGTSIECLLYAGGAGWCVEVRDEGPSIPTEQRGRLFQKFHRGPARPTGGESSTGLGLFIVRVLTEAMDGCVAYVPREPIGSVFRIELPAERCD